MINFKKKSYGLGIILLLLSGIYFLVSDIIERGNSISAHRKVFGYLLVVGFFTAIVFMIRYLKKNPNIRPSYLTSDTTPLGKEERTTHLFNKVFGIMALLLGWLVVPFEWIRKSTSFSRELLAYALTLVIIIIIVNDIIDIIKSKSYKAFSD